MLLPNNRQKTKVFQYVNTARFAYNWSLGGQENDKKGGCYCKTDNIIKREKELLKTNHTR